MRKYRVSEVYRSIQGEGYHAGCPCVVVRMAGCNLRCPFCDTKYALGQGIAVTQDQLLDAVRHYHRQKDIILLTGGEPATQQPFEELVRGLSAIGPVHLETNGTISIPRYLPFAWITASPKPPDYTCRVHLVDELKWLVGSKFDVARLQEFLIGQRYPVISLQPISQDQRATKIAIDACLENGWRLSLQLHKYIGVR